MTISKIVFLDDLLRDDFIHARAFIYQLIAEPLRQTLELELPKLRSFPRLRGLSGSFDQQKFRNYCGDPNWITSYDSIPEIAGQYLIECIPAHVMIIGYEMPRWLVRILSNTIYPWINIRLSPIRFCRDLYLILESSYFDLQQTLDGYSVNDAEIWLEAGLMRAAVLHNQLARKCADTTPNNMLIFIGQTRADASLIGSNGQLLRVIDFTKKIATATVGKNVFYKAHPADKTWGRTEKKALETITGKPVKAISTNTYTLLAGASEFDLIGISSGVLQEAEFFERKSVILHQPIGNFRAKNCCHIKFADFISPALWRKIFRKPKNEHSVDCIPMVNPNMMRSLHNAWWGYSEYMFENDKFFQESVFFSLKTRARRVLDTLTRKRDLA